jgi:triacylglycerol lipase
MAAELDLNDGVGFNLHNALFLAQLCRATYDSEVDANPNIQEVFSGLGTPVIRHFEHEPSDTHGFVATTGGLVVLAFRGTHPLSLVNWLTDADDTPRLFKGIPGLIHTGFGKAFEDIFPKAQKELEGVPGQRKLWITGHSLGGALATLASVKLGGLSSFQGIYTFGSLRVGDTEFADGYKLINWRVVNKNDIAPKVPVGVPSGPFKHVGIRQHLLENGDVVAGQIGADGDDSLSVAEFADQFESFLQSILHSSPLVEELISLLPGGQALFEPLRKFKGLFEKLIPRADDDAIPLLKTLLNQLSLRSIEEQVTNFSDLVGGDFADHFPLRSCS